MGILMVLATAWGFRRGLDPKAEFQSPGSRLDVLMSQVAHTLGQSSAITVYVGSLEAEGVGFEGPLELRVGVPDGRGGANWSPPATFDSIRARPGEPVFRVAAAPNAELVFVVGPVSREAATSSGLDIFAIDDVSYVEVHRESVAALLRSLERAGGDVVSEFDAQALGLRGELHYHVGT